MTDPRSGGTPAAAPETERTDQSALNRPIRPGMNRYRIHNTDGTTTTIEARSITQAREVALMLRRDFHCIESL